MATDDPLLIISGTPRSGTTRMAAFCSAMSNTVYPHWTGSNSDGGLEDPWIAKINEGIIKDEWPESEFSKDISGYKHRVLKLPQFVTYGDSKPIEMWFKYRPKLRLLLMVRDVEQVAHSMQANNMKTLADNPNDAAKILETQLEEFCKTVVRLGIPFQLSLIHI